MAACGARIVRLCLFAGALLLCAPHVALSQTIQAPPAVLPGAVEPGRRVPPTPPLPEPSAELELQIELPAGAKPPPALLQKIFELKQVKLEGVTAYREEELAGLYRHLLSKPITFGQFYAIADAIQARYHMEDQLVSARDQEGRANFGDSDDVLHEAVHRLPFMFRQFDHHAKVNLVEFHYTLFIFAHTAKLT